LNAKGRQAAVGLSPLPTASQSPVAAQSSKVLGFAMPFPSQYHSVTSVGWAEDIGRRDDMEDGFVYVDTWGGKRRSAFFGIYDGHGGRQCVEYVSRTLHDNVLDQMSKSGPKNQDTHEAIKAAYASTDRDVMATGMPVSGCTACTCVLVEDAQGRMLHTAHLGDARAVLVQNGKATRMTAQSDHKATDPVEMRNVIQAGGQIINDRVNGMLAISRAFGDPQLKAPFLARNAVSCVPDVRSERVQSGDMLILACDGLWDVLQDHVAAHIISEGYQLLQKLWPQGQEQALKKAQGEILARMLVEEALARNTSDNVTCMVTIL